MPNLPADPGLTTSLVLGLPPAVVSKAIECEPSVQAVAARRIRILVADDHAVVREGLRALLGTQPDFHVAGTASNGPDALRLARDRRPDIVLLDFSMPGMSGLDVMREMHRARLPGRAILLTAWVDKSDIIRLLQCGVRGVVPKDAPMELVFKSIRKVHEGELWIDRKTMVDVAAGLAQEAEPPPSRDFGLTRREREVLRLVAEGDSNKYIASSLRVSEDTVKHHLTNIFDKTGVSNRSALAVFALHHRLVDAQ